MSSAKFVPLGFLNQFELGFYVVIPFSDFLQASPSEEKHFFNLKPTLGILLSISLQKNTYWHVHKILKTYNHVQKTGNMMTALPFDIRKQILV